MQAYQSISLLYDYRCKLILVLFKYHTNFINYVQTPLQPAKPLCNVMVVIRRSSHDRHSVTRSLPKRATWKLSELWWLSIRNVEKNLNNSDLSEATCLSLPAPSRYWQKRFHLCAGPTHIFHPPHAIKNTQGTVCSNGRKSFQVVAWNVGGKVGPSSHPTEV